jgi:hypothetical protein
MLIGQDELAILPEENCAEIDLVTATQHKTDMLGEQFVEEAAYFARVQGVGGRFEDHVIPKCIFERALNVVGPESRSRSQPVDESLGSESSISTDIEVGNSSPAHHDQGAGVDLDIAGIRE